MPANISIRDGQAAVMVTKTPAWHGLGIVLENPATAADAITAAKLDWKVIKQPLYAGEQEHRGIPEYFAVVREDSPDGTIIALVRSTKVPDATKESRIELRSQDGRILVSRSYTSKDGEHGHGVTKAAWTPDSQFFVYSLESSGGHQAWHTPVQFFSRSKSKIVSLDDTLKDAVTNPHFLVSAPDSVTVELMSMRQTKTVSLHELQGR